MEWLTNTLMGGLSRGIVLNFFVFGTSVYFFLISFQVGNYFENHATWKNYYLTLKVFSHFLYTIFLAVILCWVFHLSREASYHFESKFGKIVFYFLDYSAFILLAGSVSIFLLLYVALRVFSLLM